MFYLLLLRKGLLQTIVLNHCTCRRLSSLGFNRGKAFLVPFGLLCLLLGRLLLGKLRGAVVQCLGEI